MFYDSQRKEMVEPIGTTGALGGLKVTTDMVHWCSILINQNKSSNVTEYNGIMGDIC